MWNLVYGCGFTDIMTVSINGTSTRAITSIPILVVSCLLFIFLNITPYCYIIYCMSFIVLVCYLYCPPNYTLTDVLYWAEGYFYESFVKAFLLYLRRVPHEEQVLSTLPEQTSSPSIFINKIRSSHLFHLIFLDNFVNILFAWPLRGRSNNITLELKQQQKTWSQIYMGLININLYFQKLL
jgi:hypothetical protein